MKAEWLQAHQRASQGIVVSANYREGAIMAIAREAEAQGVLATLYCSFEVSWLKHQVKRLPMKGMRTRILKRLDQVSIQGVDTSKIACVSRAAELTYLLGRRLPGGYRIAQRLMYWAKRRFDQCVGAELSGHTPSTIFAIYGAAEHTFASANRKQTLKVLHVVNSHPDDQNNLLRDLAGLGTNHRELLPQKAMRQVRHEMELADVLLVPSRFVADQLIARGLPAQKILTIPYGVDLERFRPRQTYPRDRRALRCLFVGQIAHRKGIRFLIDAARSLGRWDIEFLLVGPVVSPELLRDLPASVRWVPTLPHNDVASEMRRSDMFVLPSLEDSYGLVVLEAMSSALPVIVSDHAGAVELIQHGENGLVVPAANLAALEAAIELLASDGELRKRLGSAARASVQAGYSWSVYGARVLSETDKRRRSSAVVLP